jgi:hypothetical protein
MRIAQELSQLALRQQTTVLKEVDHRRFVDEERNRKKVQFRKLVQQRSEMLKRERKFVQVPYYNNNCQSRLELSLAAVTNTMHASSARMNHRSRK